MKKLEMLLPIKKVAEMMLLIYDHSLPIQMNLGESILEDSKESKYKFVMQKVTFEYEPKNEIFLEAALVIIDIA